MEKKREKKGELERIDIENFKGEIRHIKNNEPGKYRRNAARKKVGDDDWTVDYVWLLSFGLSLTSKSCNHCV